MYYVSSRYYDPETCRFINADAPEMLGLPNDNILNYNLFAYCNNNPVNFSDNSGYFGTPVQWICATIGSMAGWYYGDYIARGLGLSPSGKGLLNAAKYWTVRQGVVVGGAVVGRFAGTTMINLSKAFLVTQPALLLRVIGKIGTAGLATKIIYNMLKLALYDAGSIVLKAKNCPIAKDAYYQGLYGGGKDWSSSTLNNKIKNGSHFKDKLKDAMTGEKGSSVSNKKISFNFTSSIDTDLYLAIGKIDLYISGTKSNGKWNLTVSGKDRYDFDEFRLTTKVSVGNVANDLGLVMQKAGMMKPYNIKVSFSTTY